MRTKRPSTEEGPPVAVGDAAGNGATPVRLSGSSGQRTPSGGDSNEENKRPSLLDSAKKLLRAKREGEPESLLQVTNTEKVVPKRKRGRPPQKTRQVTADTSAQQEPLQVVENGTSDIYLCGTLLWAKLGKYPWWPSVVVYEQKTALFHKQLTSGPSYHVRFLGDNTTGWVKRVHPFDSDAGRAAMFGCPTGDETAMSKRKKQAAEWLLTIDEAEAASNMSVEARRAYYGPKSTDDAAPARPGRPRKRSPEQIEFEQEERRRKNQRLADLVVEFPTPLGLPVRAARSGTESPSTESADYVEGAKALGKRTMVVQQVQDENTDTSEDFSDGVCGICGLTGMMILCEGDCLRSFHLECIGVSVPPSGQFVCDECVSGQHKCFSCGVAGRDTVKCLEETCGKFYHPACAKLYPNFQQKGELFICPNHQCATCELNLTFRAAVRCTECPTAYHNSCVPAGDVVHHKNHFTCARHILVKSRKRMPTVTPRTLNQCVFCGGGGNLYCCDGCTAVYHGDCLEKDALHPDGKDRWDCPQCLEGQRPLVGDVVWAKIGSYRWWPARVITEAEAPRTLLAQKHTEVDFPVVFFGPKNYSWVNAYSIAPWANLDIMGNQKKGEKNRSFIKAIESAEPHVFDMRRRQDAREMRTLQKTKPTTWRRLAVNCYIAPRPRLENGPAKCECTPSSPCDDDQCLNRGLQIECRKDCVKNCENQRFRKREYPSTKLSQFAGRGWGLVAQERIPQGSFVYEYVGEVIDAVECQERIKQELARSSRNWYILALDEDLFIDSSRRGNIARFMNHNCDPNLEVQKWMVQGLPRIGLFALRDIEAGEELCYDYKFQSVTGDERAECRCGAKTCSGVLGSSAISKIVSPAKKPPPPLTKE